MFYWILYGVFISKSFNNTTVHLPSPLIFKNELQCLKTKQLNDSHKSAQYDKISLVCEKIKVEK